jgi:alkylated DNA repair dioxygenase AlkB
MSARQGGERSGGRLPRPSGVDVMRGAGFDSGDRASGRQDELNSALATQYSDGEATVGYHADNEPLFGTNPTVASVSLGATRVVVGVVHRSRANARPARASLASSASATAMRVRGERVQPSLSQETRRRPRGARR